MDRTEQARRSEAIARALDRVAWLMDRAITIPGTRTTVGLDALLGLIPVGGDFLTGIVQVGLVLVALAHYRVPAPVAIRMLANVLVDVGVGSIPLVGDLFDVAFKANTRNMRLLDPNRGRAQPEAFGPLGVPSITIPLPPGGVPAGLFMMIGAVLVVALGLVLVGFVTVVRWMFRGA